MKIKGRRLPVTHTAPMHPILNDLNHARRGSTTAQSFQADRPALMGRADCAQHLWCNCFFSGA